MITAFILGYEVQDRLQLASKLRDGVYPHGNSGHVGAAVAVSQLLDWNAEQIRQAINCAAALPLGTSYTPTLVDTTIATVFASFSSPVAFIVKDLVECGFIGYESALGDTFGYILGKEFNPLALTENLGIDYGIMRNYFKFHANCAITHPALEAAANALDFTIQHDEFPPYKPGLLLNPDDIKNIKIVQGTEKPAIDDFAETITVNFDEGRMVEYSYKLLDELELAYAVTIHKSQGSEYPAVVIPLLSGPRMLMKPEFIVHSGYKSKEMCYDSRR